MNDAIVPEPSKHRTAVAANAGAQVPALYAAAGPQAKKRFVEFFTANIRNPNTRRAYLKAVTAFSDWCTEHGATGLIDIEPVHVAAYIEQLQRSLSAPSVKQHLAAIRMLFDWLVVGQVIATNPASSVRGPKHSVRQGKTSVLSAAETRTLLDSVDISTVIGLRDRGHCRADDLHLRPGRRIDQDARRGLLRPGQTRMGSTP